MNPEDMKTAVLGTFRSAIERVDKNGVQDCTVDFSRNLIMVYEIDREPVGWSEKGFTIKVSVTYASPKIVLGKSKVLGEN